MLESFWNQGGGARTDELRELVKRGTPYQDIARKLGCSVGAVCGKVSRLKIGRGTRDTSTSRLYHPIRGEGKPRRPRAPAMPHEPDEEYFAIIAKLDKESAHRTDTVSLIDADDGMCRFIIGEDSKGQCCGKPSLLGARYCQHHFNRCFKRVKNEGGQSREYVSGSTGTVLRLLPTTSAVHSS